MRAALALCALLLAACGTPAAPTADRVRGVLTGLGATNIHDDPPDAQSPLPRSFTVRQAFTLPSVAPKGGQYFICDTKRNCDALYAYFDAFKALAGPYTYRSDSGLVVVQLNSGLPPDEAARVAQAIKGL